MLTRYCNFFLGWGAIISRLSSDPVRAFQGSDVTFQWTLGKNITSQPDFEGLVFGLWKKGYLATYITTVTRNERVIPNPGLTEEAPRLNGRVQWKGDLSKSLAAFQIADVSSEDQTEYGLILNFGPYRNWPSDSISLKVKGKGVPRSQPGVGRFSHSQKVPLSGIISIIFNYSTGFNR